MKPELIKTEIEKLPLDEKILLVEDILDSIDKDNNSIPVPDWQKQELDNRYKAYQTGQITTRDWKSVHADLRAKYTK